MVTDSGVATVSERAGTTIADPSDVIRVSTENTGSDFGHETAVLVPDDLPYHLVVLHLFSLTK